MTKSASPRCDRVVLAARSAADLLQKLGCPKQAEDVRRLCRANSGYRTTLSQLHGDNMELRKEIEQLKERARDAFDEGRQVGNDEVTIDQEYR